MMRTEAIAYEADGLAMEGWLAFEEGFTAHRPGVLVFPAMPGIGTQVRNAAERLASEGYVALGCDLYGGGRFYDDLQMAGGLLSELRKRLDRVRARAAGGLRALIARPEVDPSRIAAIGYCFGGVMALELARSGADIAAVAGFHTPLGTSRPEDARNIKGKILICTGSKDVEANAAERGDFEAEMDAGGVDWRLSLYGGVYHSFTNPDADAYLKPDYARYDKAAHERSWKEMLMLFDEAIGSVNRL